MKLSEIKARIDSVHAAHANWWLDLETGLPKQRNVGELLCLVHSEVSESYDGMITDIMDDHLPQYPCWMVEVADALIRLFDLIGGLGIKDQVVLQLEKNAPVGDEHFDLHHYYHNPDTILPTEHYCVIHSNISACMENHRKGRELEFYISIAETVLLLIGMMQVMMGYDPENNLVEVIDAKVAYNKQRADHKIENRKADDGKKY